MSTADTEQDALRGTLDDFTQLQEALSGRISSLEGDFKSQPDAPQTAKIAARSVFTVTTADGRGSAFVVTAQRRSSRLVTNFHVVSETYVNGGRDVKIKRGRLAYPGRIVDVSEANDLALITVSAPLPALQLESQRPQIGEPVLVLGSPLGLGGTVTSGIVSAFRNEDGLDYLQFSAPISPGNSGGPVINERGAVVGIAVAKLVGQGAEGLGFAIPTGRLCAALDVC